MDFARSFVFNGLTPFLFRPAAESVPFDKLRGQAFEARDLGRLGRGLESGAVGQGVLGFGDHAWIIA